jgi:hypothetical protein
VGKLNRLRKSRWEKCCGGTHVEDQDVDEPIELPDGIGDRKGYELWEQRGYRVGHDLEDWCDAEASVVEEIRDACE